MKNILRKTILFALPLLLVIGIGSASLAETWEGMVIARSGNAITLYADGNIRAVKTDDGTAFETESELRIGDVVTVSGNEYDAATLIAETVVCHILRGTVTEITDTEEPYLLLEAAGGETVRVNLSESDPERFTAGIPVTVYYNGMQTRSIPPQITAQYIRGIEITGTVTAVSEDGMMLCTEDGESVFLHRSEETLVPVDIEAGNTVRASVLPQMRLSLPAQYEAQDILKIGEEK